jgi:hypothetical protein
MIPSQIWPRLHLEEETATAADLHSYLLGFTALMGRGGIFGAGRTDVLVVWNGQLGWLVHVIHKNGAHRLFVVKPDNVRVIASSDPTPRDTEGFHAWYITSHLRAHLAICFREREAKAA